MTAKIPKIDAIMYKITKAELTNALQNQNFEVLEKKYSKQILKEKSQKSHNGQF